MVNNISVFLFQTLKSSYELIVLELKKVQEVYSLRKGGTDFSRERKLAELLTHITEYVSARKEMIELYLSPSVLVL